MSTLTSPSPSPTLVRAIRHVLCPLVRLMLASGVTYQIVSELLKGVFVEVADREYRLDDRAPTDSRISLLTGVHRKDVRRLRGADGTTQCSATETVPFSARVIATWLGNPRFLDEAGWPRPLLRLGGDAADVSFEELVASHSKDSRARVVLDEWLRLGIVKIDERDKIVLNTEAFIPAEGLDEKLHYFASHLHDHAAVATNNLLGSRPPQLERSVMYAGMTESSIARLDQRARQLGMKMLKDLNRLAIDLAARDETSAEPRGRFTSGVYFYSEPVAEEATRS